MKLTIIIACGCVVAMLSGCNEQAGSDHQDPGVVVGDDGQVAQAVVGVVGELIATGSRGDAFREMSRLRLREGGCPKFDPYVVWLQQRLLIDSIEGRLFRQDTDGNVRIVLTWDQGDDKSWYIIHIGRHCSPWEEVALQPTIVWGDYLREITQLNPGEDFTKEEHVLSRVSPGELLTIKIIACPRSDAGRKETIDPMRLLERASAIPLFEIVVPVVVE